MSTIKILGIDLGKTYFHLIGRNDREDIVFQKKFTRTKLLEYLAQLAPCLIAFEACGGAHWLARVCQSYGHQVRLIPPQYVKPYVQGNKTDFIDAQAIAEACSRPHMRFVPVKTEAAQTMSACHRLREGYIKERTALMSRIGAILLEFGLSLPKGHPTMKTLFFWLAKQKHITLPVALMAELQSAFDHYLYLNERIAEQDEKIKQWVEQDELCQLVKTIPGVGDMTASQLIMRIGDGGQFKNGRHLAAWLGLVPKQYATGGKQNLLGISKRGNKQLRCLFIHGARAVLSRWDEEKSPFSPWLKELKKTKPFNVVCVALANKLARIAWAVLSRKQVFVG